MIHREAHREGRGMQLTLGHRPAHAGGRRPGLAPTATRLLAGAGATTSALWSAVLALLGVYRH